MENGADLMEVEKFMQKNNVILKHDLERYEILIPFLNIAGRRRKEFLCSELEKMHPCFSDEFTFDSVIKKICKKGLWEDVFVMNKYRLAEYERKHHFSGSGFYVEKDSKKKDFPVKSLFQRRLFVEKKWQLTLYGIIACILIGSCGVIFSALAAAKSSANIKKTGTLVEPLSLSAASYSQEIQTEASFASELSPVSKLFTIAHNNDGKIKSLEWQLVSNNGAPFESLNASVMGIFPEYLSDFSCDSVIYEEGIPRTNIFAKKNLKSNTATTPDLINKVGLNSSTMPATDTGLANADFNKTLRSEITNYGGKLKEEKAPPYHIEFYCEKKLLTEKKQMLQKLSEIINSDKRHISSININQTGLSELRIGLTIEKGLCKGSFDLAEAGENLELFIDTTGTSSNKTLAGGKGMIKEKTDSAGNNLYQDESQKLLLEKGFQKIGEIKRSGKSTIVYFKSPDGKLKTIEK